MMVLLSCEDEYESFAGNVRLSAACPAVHGQTRGHDEKCSSSLCRLGGGLDLVGDGVELVDDEQFGRAVVDGDP